MPERTQGPLHPHDPIHKWEVQSSRGQRHSWGGTTEGTVTVAITNMTITKDGRRLFETVRLDLSPGEAEKLSDALDEHIRNACKLEDEEGPA